MISDLRQTVLFGFCTYSVSFNCLLSSLREYSQHLFNIIADITMNCFFSTLRHFYGLEHFVHDIAPMSILNHLLSLLYFAAYRASCNKE